jgi:hypothetical protein
MSHHLRFLLLATALLGLGGCASAPSNTRTEPSAHVQEEASSLPACPMCPMSVEGVQVAAEDVEGGAALSFTTATGDVGALRAQVVQIAERHNARHASASSPRGDCCQQAGQGGSGHPGKHAAMGKGLGMPMMAAMASVEEVAGGARLVLRADDPSQLETLRQHVHRHAEMMSSGGCSCVGRVPR